MEGINLSAGKLRAADIRFGEMGKQPLNSHIVEAAYSFPELGQMRRQDPKASKPRVDLDMNRGYAASGALRGVEGLDGLQIINNH